MMDADVKDLVKKRREEYKKLHPSITNDELKAFSDGMCVGKETILDVMEDMQRERLYKNTDKYV